MSVFSVISCQNEGDCTQGCVYFVYLYTLGAKKKRLRSRAGKNTHYYIYAQARERMNNSLPTRGTIGRAVNNEQLTFIA